MNWNDLKIFLAVARNQSLRRAAEQTGQSISTVSRRIDALEQALGATLFHRRSGGYALTTTGQAILENAIALEHQATDIEQTVSSLEEHPRGLVTVTLPDGVFIYLLAEALDEFRKRHREINLRIIATDDVVDLQRGEADIALRFTNAPPEYLVGRKLAICHHHYYADHTYLRKFLAMSMDDAMWIGNGHRAMEQNDRIAQGPFPELPVRWDIQSFPSVVAACKRGLGMAILPCFIGDTEPDLARIGNEKSFAHVEIWLLTHSELKDARRIRVVMDFIATIFSKKRALIEGEAKA